MDYNHRRKYGSSSAINFWHNSKVIAFLLLPLRIEAPFFVKAASGGALAQTCSDDDGDDSSKINEGFSYLDNG
jgi:hypothetical protein